MDKILDGVKNAVKKQIMLPTARFLNAVSGGKLSPDAITYTGLFAHLPIAYFIATGRLDLAAGLLIVFGLFDALDGELARLQKRDSATGMFLDSVTDRMKEIFLYGGVTYYLINNGQELFAVWAVIALGGSMLTTYMNAWGEVALSKSGFSDGSVNQTLRSGLLRFEVRMFLLVVALFTNQLEVFVVFVAIFAWITALQRMRKVTKKLGSHV